jgi:Retinal pigment epithelial membrane protein
MPEQHHRSGSAPFPRAMMRASAAELDGIALQLVEGEIPADLRGHLFLVAPVGSVNSNGLPNPDDCHVWNGNGFIHRFDLSPGEPIRLTARLVKTPCYWADLATRCGMAKASLGFHDWGMARFSLRLGMRNVLNTAFVPMRFKAGEATRLLLTFDGGRPYEIDPLSLSVVTPVGSNDEWRPGARLPWMPFPMVLSTAHPVFDAASSMLYTVNYGRSMANLLATIPPLFGPLPGGRLLARLIRPLARLARWIVHPLGAWLQQISGLEDFVLLLGWDGQGPLHRWSLVDGEGNPLKIRQTMHQIGISHDYVVLADTSLKFGLGQVLPLPGWLRRRVTGPQRPDTRLHLVRKADLASGAQTVAVRSLTLPLEIGHFLVEAENPAGRITVHAGHEPATDVSEWLRKDDVSATDSKPLDPALQGMIAVGAMDVGRVGRYVIDGETGTLLESSQLSDERFTWGIGLVAGRQLGCDGIAAEGRLTFLYWQSLGYWPDLMTRFIADLYADYPHRLVPIQTVLQGGDGPGRRPSTLFRVDTASMTIADAYPMPQLQLEDGSWQAWVCNSPQFIPRTQAMDDRRPINATDASTDGWIACQAISEWRKEMWIFDAADLAQGPICRLSHPQFDPGYTIHTAWLPSIEQRQATYRIDPRKELDPLQRASRSVRELFAQQVYPNLEGP